MPDPMTNKADGASRVTPSVPSNGTHATTPWLGMALVAAIALVVRLVHIWSITEVPTARHLIGDAAGYYEWAQRISTGAWVGDRGFYQAPLYPYALAVWRLFGPTSVLGIQILQALWGGAACALLCLAATRIFCTRVGFLSGLMPALYGPAIYFDGIIQKASLDGLLVCAMLVCMSLIFLRCTSWHCALLGAVVSLLCLTRENAIAWHFVLVAWITWYSLRCVKMHPTKTTRVVLVYLLGAGVVLLPVGLRNLYVQGEFLLTTSQAGPNFFIGNNANADGRYQPLVRGHETPTFEQRDATALAEEAKGRELSPREVSRYWVRRAFRDIAADPIRWLRLTGYKLLLVWNEYEIADAESVTIYRRHSPMLGVFGTVWNFGGLAPLAILGIALTWDSRRRLWVFYALIITMTLAVAAFYVLARYRFPLVPLLIPFAAVGCVELWRRRGRLQTVVRPLSLAILTAMLVNWPIQNEKKLDALADMNAGVALAQTGEIEEAAGYFALAVKGHPDSAEANYNLALALAMQGKFTEAIPYYENAIQSQFDLIGAHYNLAVALEQTGRPEEALKHYELALRQDPDDAEARAAMGRLRNNANNPSN